MKNKLFELSAIEFNNENEVQEFMVNRLEIIKELNKTIEMIKPYTSIMAASPNNEDNFLWIVEQLTSIILYTASVVGFVKDNKTTKPDFDLSTVIFKKEHDIWKVQSKYFGTDMGKVFKINNKYFLSLDPAAALSFGELKSIITFNFDLSNAESN